MIQGRFFLHDIAFHESFQTLYLNLSEQFCHIIWKSCCKNEALFRYRVMQNEFATMQCLPVDSLTRPTVQIIASKRMANMGKMHTNLVRPPRLQFNINESVFVCFSDCRIVSRRLFSCLCNRSLDDRAVFAPDR